MPAPLDVLQAIRRPRLSAADLILKGLNGAIASQRVIYNLARQMEGGTAIKNSAFGDNLIGHM